MREVWVDVWAVKSHNATPHLRSVGPLYARAGLTGELCPPPSPSVDQPQCSTSRSIPLRRNPALGPCAGRLVRDRSPAGYGWRVGNAASCVASGPWEGRGGWGRAALPARANNAAP
eukprot:scaffold415_cov362-Prasinococcus_capsulatus_cf.AAC.4